MKSEIRVQSSNLKVIIPVTIISAITVIILAFAFRFEFGAILLSIAFAIAGIAFVAIAGRVSQMRHNSQMSSIERQKAKEELRIVKAQAARAELESYVLHFSKNERVIMSEAAPVRMIEAAIAPAGQIVDGKAQVLPAVSFGVVVRIGQMGLQRVPLLKKLVRTEREEPSDAKLVERLLQQVGQGLEPDEVALFDAGFKMAALQAAEIERAVVRLAVNVTAHRNYPVPYKGRGRHPVYGQRIRPLARKRKEHVIEASPPDFSDEFEYEGRTIKIKGWYDLILPKVVPHPDNHTFDIYVFEDPLYRDPLVLGTTLRLRPATSFALYQDRWPVEQVPLAAKHMVGAHRQFVFADQSCQRWPELALIVGGILTYLAAALPPIPTGFWDKQPKATPGRLRRLLARVDFPKDYPFLAQLRKKRAVTDHLPKGVAAHRRSKAVV